MNPLILKKTAVLRERLDELRDILEAQRQDVIKQHEEKEDLLQEQWSQRKDLTTLNRIAKDFDEVDAENKRYRDERAALYASLQKIIGYSKALHEIQKP